MDEQTKLAAVMAAMEEELGIGRRNALPLEDRKGWGSVDVEELNKTRAARNKGTAEWKQAQKDASKLSGWKYQALANVESESDGEPEDMNAGQSHRLRMKAEIANSSHQSQRRGDHISRASSRVARGRGGGLAGANRTDRRAQGAFNDNTHAGLNKIMPSSKVNVRDYLIQQLNIPSAPGMSPRGHGTQSKPQTKPQITEPHSTLSSRSKSRRSKLSSHDESQPLNVVSNAQRAALRPQTTAYNLADPETFLQSSWKPNPGLSGSKYAPVPNTTLNVPQTKGSLVLRPSATTQNTPSKEKPAAENFGLAGSRYADQASVTAKMPSLSSVDLVGSKNADHAINPFENKPIAPPAGLDGSRFADQANVQESTNPFQAKSFTVVAPSVQDYSHGGPGGRVFIDTMCKFELANKRYDNVRVILLESAVDHKRYISFTNLIEGVLLKECISSDLKVSSTARAVSLKIPLQYGGNTACRVMFSSILIANNFVSACSDATKDVDRNDDNMQGVDKLDPGEQLISLGDSEYDQTPVEYETPVEPSYSMQMLSLMGPENMDLALEKLDKLSGGDFLKTVIAATEREGEEAQSADLPHDVHNKAEVSKEIDYRGGLAASKYATDSPYKSIRSKHIADTPYKPVHLGVHTAAVVNPSPGTQVSEFEVDDKFRAMINRVLTGDLSASMYANTAAQSIVGELLTGSNTFKNFNGKERESFTQGFANMMVDRAITKRTGAVEEAFFSDGGAVSESKDLQKFAPETTIKIQDGSSSDNNALKPIASRRLTYTQEEMMACRPNAVIVEVSLNDEPKSQADYKVPAAAIANSPSPKADFPETASKIVIHNNACNNFQQDPIDDVDVSKPAFVSAPTDLVVMSVNQDNQNSVIEDTTGTERPLIDFAMDNSPPSLDLLNMASMPSMSSGQEHARQEQNAGKDENVDKEQNIEKEQDVHKEQLTLQALRLETENPADSRTLLSKPVLKSDTPAEPDASSDVTKGLTRGLENSRWAPISSEVKTKAAAWNGKEFKPSSGSKTQAILRPLSQLPISVLPQSANHAAILASTAPPYSTPSTATFTPTSLPYRPAQKTQQPAYEVFWVRDAAGRLREFRAPLLHGGASSPFIVSPPHEMHSVAQTQPVAIGSPQISFFETASTVHHQVNAGMQQSTWHTAPVQPQQARLTRPDHGPFTPPPGNSDVATSGSIMGLDTADSPFPKPCDFEDSPSITVQRELQKRLERSLAHKNNQRKVSDEQGDSNQFTEPSW